MKLDINSKMEQTIKIRTSSEFFTNQSAEPSNKRIIKDIIKKKHLTIIVTHGR